MTEPHRTYRKIYVFGLATTVALGGLIYGKLTSISFQATRCTPSTRPIGSSRRSTAGEPKVPPTSYPV